MTTAFERATLTVAALAFDSVWQGALIAGTVWAGLALLPRIGAATRYAIWLCTLVAVTLVPVATLGLTGHRPVGPAASVPAPATRFERVIVVRSGPADAPGEPEPGSGVAVPAPALGDRAPRSTPTRITVPAELAALVALVWLAAVALRAFRLASDAVGLSRIRREARPWSRAYAYPVFVSDALRVPIAVGLIRPAILLPAALVERLAADALDAVILHEAAHLRRGDVATNALARIAEGLSGLNPAAWFVARRLCIEREIACDDRVVAATGAGESLARTLLELASGARPPIAAPSALGSRHALVVRIERLLDSAPRRVALSRPALATAALTLVVIALLLQAVAPVFAFAPASYSGDRLAVSIGGAHRIHVAGAPEAADEAGAARTIRTLADANHIREITIRAGAEADVATLSHLADVAAGALHLRAEPRRRLMERSIAAVVEPVYPAGWSARNPGSCKVPVLDHARFRAGFVASTAQTELLPPLETMNGMALGAQRTAVVRVAVGPGGSPSGAVLVRSSGRRALDDAALATARRATYPLTEVAGFRQVRPSGQTLAWNAAHTSDAYTACTPQPPAYVWSITFGNGGFRTITLPSRTKATS